VENLILNNLKHDGALYRVRGILQCIDKQSMDIAEQRAVEHLTDDSVLVAGREVGAYARAALQILLDKPIDSTDSDSLELARILPGNCKMLLN